MYSKFKWQLGVGIIISSWLLPLGELNLNRITKGTLIYLNDLPYSQLTYSLIGFFVVLWGLQYFKKIQYVEWLVIIIPCWLLIVLSSMVDPQHLATARIGLGLGSYLLLAGVLIYLSAYHPFKWYLGVLLGGIVILGWSGYLDQLGLMKELANSKTTIIKEIYRHLWLALSSATFAVGPAVILGYLCYRHPRLNQWIMGVVNLFQVAPTISLIGLVMIPLSLLSAAYPWLAAIGIKGIGFAPAFIVLTLYCLLPIVANTYAGLSQLDESVLISARGMGMTDRQIMWKIALPLALPAIISGIRIAFTQNIGNTILAGLVGGGGMGTIIFLGLSQAASDLIILGAIPVVLMALITDQLWEWIEHISKVRMGLIHDTVKTSK